MQDSHSASLHITLHKRMHKGVMNTIITAAGSFQIHQIKSDRVMIL